MSLFTVGIFGIVGLVGALVVIGLTKIAESLRFRPLAQWRVITDGQQGSTDGQVTSDLERASGNVLSLGERKTGAGGITIQTEVIERLKASLNELNKLSQEEKALKFKIARLNHLLEEKTRALASVEEAETSQGKIHELETKITIQTEEMKRLRAKLEMQDQLLQEKTVKLFSMEHATEKQDAEKEEEMARLESKETHLNRILQENTTTALSSTEEAAKYREQQLTRDLPVTNQRQLEREELSQMKTVPCTGTDREQLNMLIPETIVNKADSISVTEVADSLKILNAQIEQGSSLITDSLLNQEWPSTGTKPEIVWDEVNDFIGSMLCNDLKRRSKELIMGSDPLITQITLQTGLVNACNRIINNCNNPFWVDGLMRSRAYSSIERTNGPATADTRSVLLQSQTSVSQGKRQEANKRYLIEVLLRLITAVGGSLENGILPSQYNEVLDDVLKQSLKLHKVVSEDLVPMTELVTDTIPCDTEFDPSRMVDTEGSESKTGSGRVVCTVEIGLRYRKTNELWEKNGSGEEWRVTMKSKVVLATTLELVELEV